MKKIIFSLMGIMTALTLTFGVLDSKDTYQTIHTIKQMSDGHTGG
ncbi:MULTISPECIES: hypothetical protein [Bacillus]|nr:hypothetical protein [Bacillus cereus]AQQ64319.1 hypothetical Protein FORC21_3524 [Bacillus cereus]MCQ6334336.1 hypothetical protein [Bacillus cereus]SMD94121.1 hypothetical protein BACERE00196_02314 [Bacillus cereus]